MTLADSEIKYIEEILGRKMNELEEQLSGCGFFRCNKGFLVNMREVDGMIESDCLIGGEKIPVSRRRRTEFMDCLTEML